jgi:hypothetical protein
LFDPNSILDSLSRGNFEVFNKVDEPPVVPDLPYTGSVYWGTNDFLDVAKAFHEFQWKESPSAWGLHYVEFVYDCNNIGNGPYYAGFSFIKIAWQNNQWVRFKHDIQLNLLSKSVQWIEAVRTPALENWQAIDLADIKVSAADALKMAEANGGEEARQKAENKVCTIALALTPNGLMKPWRVDYSVVEQDRLVSLLTFEIDSATGKLQIIYPKSK